MALKAKMLRKSGRYWGTWFLVSRSFESQRSWKKASTQEGSKGAARKTLVERTCKKKTWRWIPRNTQAYRGNWDHKWQRSDSLCWPDPVVKLSLCTQCYKAILQTGLVVNVLITATHNEHMLDFCTYTDHCLLVSIPRTSWSKEHLLYKYIRINYMLLASYNLSLKG